LVLAWMVEAGSAAGDCPAESAGSQSKTAIKALRKGRIKKGCIKKGAPDRSLDYSLHKEDATRLVKRAWAFCGWLIAR
jgi:hypothetical protein